MNKLGVDEDGVNIKRCLPRCSLLFEVTEDGHGSLDRDFGHHTESCYIYIYMEP